MRILSLDLHILAKLCDRHASASTAAAATSARMLNTCSSGFLIGLNLSRCYCRVDVGLQQAKKRGKQDEQKHTHHIVYRKSRVHKKLSSRAYKIHSQVHVYMIWWVFFLSFCSVE